MTGSKGRPWCAKKGEVHWRYSDLRAGWGTSDVFGFVTEQEIVESPDSKWHQHRSDPWQLRRSRCNRGPICYTTSAQLGFSKKP